MFVMTSQIHTRSNGRAFTSWLAMLAIAGGISLMQGCATPAISINMVVKSDEARPLRESSLHGGIVVRNVTGGTETNPMWMSKVSNAEFKTALENSFKSAQLLGAEPATARYRLDATLLSLDQPMIGFDLTVTCNAQYHLFEAGTGMRVFAKTITTPFTARVSDSFVAVERLRIANEGAVRENIRQILSELFSLEFSKTAPFTPSAR